MLARLASTQEAFRVWPRATTPDKGDYVKNMPKVAVLQHIPRTDKCLGSMSLAVFASNLAVDGSRNDSHLNWRSWRPVSEGVNQQQGGWHVRAGKAVVVGGGRAA